MPEKNDNSIGYVVMPLLCTLVGAVAFVSFAMATVNTAAMAEVESSEVPPLDERISLINRDIACMEDSITSIVSANRETVKQIRERISERARIAKLDPRGPQEIDHEIDSLRGAIRNLENQNEEIREQIRKPKEPTVKISEIYGGTGGQGRPTFVECVDGAVILQPQNQTIYLDRIEKDNYRLTSHLEAKGYVVFCVRPDGYESFLKARHVAESLEIKIGYDPFNNDWVLKY